MKKVWRYDLPSIKGEGWATILLTEDGIFTAVSDWGNYSYWWSAHGMSDFRLFFLDKDMVTYPDYILRKLAPKVVYDPHATYQQAKQTILELRRDRHIDRAEAREAFIDLDDTYSKLVSEYDFNCWMNAYNNLIDEIWEIGCYSPDQHAQMFVKMIMPRLQKAIELELASEQPTPPA